MAATYGDFPRDHTGTCIKLDPRANRVAVCARLLQVDSQVSTRSSGHVLPNLNRRAAIDDGQIQQTVLVQINQCSTASAMRRRNASSVAGFCPIALTFSDQQRIRIQHRVSGHLFDVALGNKDVVQSVVLNVTKRRVPSGRGTAIFARVGPLRRRAPTIGRINPRRRSRAFHHLKPLVAHRRQHDIRQTVARHIAAGNAHAPQLVFVPAILFGQQAGRFIQTPKLF